MQLYFKKDQLGEAQIAILMLLPAAASALLAESPAVAVDGAEPHRQQPVGTKSEGAPRARLEPAPEKSAGAAAPRTVDSAKPLSPEANTKAAAQGRSASDTVRKAVIAPHFTPSAPEKGTRS